MATLHKWKSSDLGDSATLLQWFKDTETLLCHIRDAAASQGATYSVQATVDFGYAAGGEGDTATVTVAAAWVDAGAIIICAPAMETTADHDPDDALIESILPRATNIVPGVSFDIEAYAQNGSWGRYVINAIAA